ncbi:MAG: carboxy terminal-processing peptidase [Lacipirellulaceae bacterium]
MRSSLAGSSRRGRLVLCLFAVALVATIGPVALARPDGPSTTDRQIAIAVRLLMEQKHVSRVGFNDESSKRCFKAYLEALDPWKLYFQQGDIDAFTAEETALDDLLRRGDTSFAFRVFERFLSRVGESSTVAQEWVAAEHDFKADEQMLRKREETTYASGPEQAREAWRKRIKYELLLELADDTPLDEAREKLRKRYSTIGKRWEQTSDDELLEFYLTAMTSGFDPHSSYMSPSTLENFNIQMKLELDGIGASLRTEDGYTEVHEIIAGGAADQHGKLKVGDKIVGVGQGTAGPVDDIVDMKINDVVKLIRGKRGTVVRLQVKPIDNPKESIEYAITRARIELKNQEARSAVVDWGKKPNGQPYRLGVIHLPSFYMDMDGARAGVADYRSTTRDVARLLEGFNADAQGIDAVVVDLRFNGGGSLTEAVNMTGLFIDRGPVVQVKGPDGRTQPYDDETPGMQWQGPLVVLTNKFSASASEIFAGAIQDYGRGIVVGDEATHGKGTVQQLFDLGNAIFRIGERPNLGALKMTIQQFYRPGGDSTQNRGVLADVTIPSLTDHLEGITEAEMDFALPFDRVRALEHDQMGMSASGTSSELQRLSDERTAASKEFQEDFKRIDRYESQKERETVTLNLDEYLAERKELDAEKQEEEIGEKMSDSDRPVFDVEDHYNKESMSIVIDYLKLLRENKVAIAR